MKLQGISDAGMKRVAQMVDEGAGNAEGEELEYYFNIYNRFAEEDYEDDYDEKFKDIAIPDSDAITDASISIDDEVMSWLNANIGHTHATGHMGDDELGGIISIKPGTPAHEFVLDALEDEGHEPYMTSKGNFPFDFKVPDNMFFNVALSFNRVTNWGEKDNPKYEAAEAFHQ